MMDTTSVPLMMDIEGGEADVNNKEGVENDFAYNNNVAGASKHVRLGRYPDLIYQAYNITSSCRLHEESLWPALSPADHHHPDRRSVPFHSRSEGVCPGDNLIIYIIYHLSI